MTRVMLVTLAALLAAAVSPAQPPGGVDPVFVEHAKYMGGDWDVKVTIDDKTSDARMSVQGVPGQYAYVLRWQGTGTLSPGTPRATGLGGWDAEKKAIRDVWQSNDGDSVTHLMRPTGEGALAGEARGVAGGKSIRHKIRMERKGPDEWVWKATEVVIGDEKQPDRILHGRRVPPVPPVPNKLPEDARKLLQYFVGEWDCEASSGDQKATCRFAYRWAPQRPCLQYDYRVRIGNRDDQNSGLLGWNTADKQLIFAEFGTSGHQSILRLTRQPDDAWAGTYDGTLDSTAAASRGACRLERKGPDEFVLSGKGTNGDQPSEWKAVYRRVKPKP